MRTLSAKSDPDAFFHQIEHAEHSLLLLDYDGTLAPFHVRPMMARPYPGVIESLDSILATGGTRMVLLSGRRAAEVAMLLPLKRRPEIWGLDGWERLMPDGKVTVRAPSVQSRHELHEALALLRNMLPAAARVEVKQASLVVHWRGVPALIAATIKQKTTETWQRLQRNSGIDLLSFDGGLKLSDRGSDRNAAWEILSQCPEAVPAAYLGDDAFDEEGFSAVRNCGLGVLVRPTLRPTAADLWIRPPRELIAFLTRWNQAMKAGKHPVQSF